VRWPAARGEHRHGTTLGAATRRQRELDAFGRGFVLGRYAPLASRPLVWLSAALIDRPGPDPESERAISRARRHGCAPGARAGGAALSRSPAGVPWASPSLAYLRALRMSLGGTLPGYFRASDRS
jgi:hypothetical protein